MKLNPKRRAFIVEYLKDFDGKNAAIRAGYSPRNAASTACNLLKIPTISKQIDEYLDNLKMDATEALQLLGTIARDGAGNIQLRALEKVIDVHGLTKAPELQGSITLRVEYGKRASHTAKRAVSQAVRDSHASGQEDGTLHGTEVREDDASGV